MKRLLWLMCLSCSIAALTACGGGTTKKPGDGGVEGDGSAANTTNLDAIKKEADDTQKQVGDLAKSLDGVKTDVASAAMDTTALDTRVKNLETPAVPTPLDGIMLAQMGILDLVQKACTYEGTCCDADELTLKYGPTIQSSQDCIDTFNALVAKGVNPDFLSGSVPVVQYVVSLAQALSSSEIKVSLDKTAIKACTDWLDQRECTKYVAPPDPTVVVAPHCTPPADVVANPCDVATLVTGMQDKGEVCGIVFGVAGCKDGLVCRVQSSGGGNTRGICTDPVGEGGRCLNDGECDGTLFCNLTKGQCQKRGAEGDACEFLDPSFTSNQFNPSAFTSNQVLAIQCGAGLECQPTTKKCAKVCTEGSVCSDPQYNSGLLCPEGFVCNVTEVPSLYANTGPGTASYRLGVCRAAAAVGDACTLATGTSAGTECDSGNCQLTSGGSYVCGDPKKAVGDACTAAGPDATCKTGWCGTDLKCVTTCVLDTILEQYTCAAGLYCETQQPIPGVGGYACEPMIVSGGACSVASPGDRHSLCVSGFCNTTVTDPTHNYGTCQDKVAAGAACPTGLSQQCQLTEWCDPSATPTANTCAPVVATGGDCSTKPNGCGVGAYCYYNAAATPNPTYTCRTPGDADATCVGAVGSTQDCKPHLVCAGDNKCHQTGMYPDGVPCGANASPNDAQCLNGWCSGASATSTTKPFICAMPLAADADCDTADTYLNRCAKTTYCAHDAGATTGKCTAQHTSGQACEPRFGGTDCLNSLNNSNPCVETNGVFVCGQQSLAPMTALCDGTP